MVKLAEAIAVIPLVKRALPEARLPMQDVRTLGSMGAAALAGQVIRTVGARQPGRRTAGREAAVALVSVAPALLALRSGDLAAYHGVEHKAIAGYEEGSDAADADEGARPLRLSPRRADARGGHAVGRSSSAAPACAARPPRRPWASAARRSPSRCSPGASAIPTPSLTRLMRRPGFEIQRAVGTREPTEEQLEVGRAALAEILRVEGGE